MRAESCCSLTALHWCMWNEFTILDPGPRKQMSMLQNPPLLFRPSLWLSRGMVMKLLVVLGQPWIKGQWRSMGWEWVSSFNGQQSPFKILAGARFKTECGRVRFSLLFYQWKKFWNLLTWKIQAQKEQLGFQQVSCFFPCCPSGFTVTEGNQALPLMSGNIWIWPPFPHDFARMGGAALCSEKAACWVQQARGL